MTEIEIATFTENSAHWVRSIAYGQSGFAISLSPFNDDSFEVRVVFSQVSDMRIDASYADGELSFPWDIIGFESEKLSDDLWQFVLHTDMVEYSFRASWPIIERRTPTEPIAKRVHLLRAGQVP